MNGASTHSNKSTSDGGKSIGAHYHTDFPVLEKETGKLFNYGQLRRHPQIADIWNRSYANEMGQIFQGVATVDIGVGKRIEVTDTFHVVRFKDIPKYHLKEVCYTSVVCELRPGKRNPNCTRIIICGGNVSYRDDVGIKTASLELFKLMINITLSRKGARFACFNVENFYHGTPLDWPEYVKIIYNYQK